MPRTKTTKKAKTKTKTKATKKAVKKVVKKEKRGRKKGSYKRINDTEELYVFINKVQFSSSGKKFRMILQDDFFPIAENIMSDLGIDFESYISEGRRTYIVSYTPPEPSFDLTLDELDDEFLKDGQLF